MILSMTGFGKTVTHHELADIKVEMKSVNSKYLDAHIRLPRGFQLLEIQIRTMLSEILQRGKVDVSIDIRPKRAKSVPKVNEQMLAHYTSVLNAVRDACGVREPLTLENMLHFNDIIEVDEDDTFEDDVTPIVIDAIRECAERVNEMRAREGENLANDLKEKLGILADITNDIDEKRKYVYEYWLDRFRKRMDELQLGTDFEERIVAEAAVLSEKADISEEITRLRSHIDMFASIIRDEPQCGKKLDFLCQELNREFNTIGSKSGKVEVINQVVAAKSELDRIREQVQNIV